MAKYPLTYYKQLLGLVVDYLENKPNIVEDLINFAPKADKEALKDLFNLY